MTTLPIVERELRVASRRRMTYGSRLAGAGIACGVTAWLLVRASVALSPAQAGSNLFETLSNIAFMACLAAGALLTADCISEEKREGTLGLLFLTDLRGRDVVFGKLAGTSLHAFYMLLGALPVMMIPLLLGGVTTGELLRMTMVLLNTMFFSLAVGMFISTLNVRQRRTIFITTIVLFVVGLAFHFMGGVLRRISPRWTYQLAFEADFIPRPWNFYLSCLWVHGAAWGFLVWACWLAPRKWQEQKIEPAVAADEAVSLWPVLDETTGEALPLGAPPLRDGNPIKWLADRDGRTPAWMWVTLVLSAMAWLMVHPVFNSNRRSVELAILGGILFHAVLKCWIAWEATLRFAADRRCGALEVLLSTPLTVREILEGQLSSLFNLFLKPILAVVIVDLTLLVSGWQSGGAPSNDVLTGFSLVVMLTFIIDIAAIALLGMWLGLKTRGASAPLVQTVGQVMMVPTVIFAVVAFGLLSAGGVAAMANYRGALLLLWFLIGTTNSLVCILNAFRGLQERFRELATLQTAEVSRKREVGIGRRAEA
jgi:ABC-type Na+ efflux pump permease subunit